MTRERDRRWGGMGGCEVREGSDRDNKSTQNTQ